MAKKPPVSAAMLAIGDEILSGRTKDKNIGHLAETLAIVGIDLKEVRIVSDEPGAIAEALNALRDRHDYVFTSGGIGPTHDDVTADAVAAAFSLPIEEHPEAVGRLAAYYEQRGIAFTEARRRMTRTPRGATLIDNPVSVAPGFRVGNVFVMAGVPQIFAAMVEQVLPSLPAGEKMQSVTIASPFGEGDVGTPLRAIAKTHPAAAIGSYPKFIGDRYLTEIVIRSRDPAALEEARGAVEEMLDALERELNL